MFNKEIKCLNSHQKKKKKTNKKNQTKKKKFPKSKNKKREEKKQKQKIQNQTNKQTRQNQPLLQTSRHSHPCLACHAERGGLRPPVEELQGQGDRGRVTPWEPPGRRRRRPGEASETAGPRARRLGAGAPEVGLERTRAMPRRKQQAPKRAAGKRPGSARGGPARRPGGPGRQLLARAPRDATPLACLSGASAPVPRSAPLITPSSLAFSSLPCPPLSRLRLGGGGKLSHQAFPP